MIIIISKSKFDSFVFDCNLRYTIDCLERIMYKGRHASSNDLRWWWECVLSIFDCVFRVFLKVCNKGWSWHPQTRAFIIIRIIPEGSFPAFLDWKHHKEKLVGTQLCTFSQLESNNWRASQSTSYLPSWKAYFSDHESRDWSSFMDNHICSYMFIALLMLSQLLVGIVTIL